MNDNQMTDELYLFAGKIKNACIKILLESFETALTDGLCCEGALEYSVKELKAASPEELMALSASTKNDS